MEVSELVGLLNLSFNKLWTSNLSRLIRGLIPVVIHMVCCIGFIECDKRVYETCHLCSMVFVTLFVFLLYRICITTIAGPLNHSALNSLVTILLKIVVCLLLVLIARIRFW